MLAELPRTDLAADGWLDPLDKSAPPLPCQVEDSDLWFSDSPAELQAAKILCRDCPAIRACLAGALERREAYGVWGGEIVIGGVVVAEKRRRGRPKRAA
jgi:WhiB family transcriptional regulator, redox-sensing transcriptional regulator